MKSGIRLHRSYRKISGSAKGFLIQFILLPLPLSALIVFFYPEVTRVASGLADMLLEPYFGDGIRAVASAYVVGNVNFLDFPGRFPSPLFALVNAIASLIIVGIVSHLRKAKPVMIFLTIIGFVNLCSSLFFLFIPERFPYEGFDYSELYMKQQVSIWFFVPIIMGIGALPLPASLLSKTVAIGCTFCYSVVFGSLRYAVFLFILGKVSMLYMAVLFFALGPLIDFVYIVGIYSIYATRFATTIKKDRGIWKWSY